MLYLVNDDGDGLLPGLLLNGTGSVGNSQCTIFAPGSSAIGANAELTLTLSLAFSQSTFSGTRVVYLAANDSTGAATGWKPMGVVSVPSSSPSYPSPLSLSPSAVVTYNTPLALLYQDLTNYQNFKEVQLLIGSSTDDARACHIAFFPSGPSSGSLVLAATGDTRDRMAPDQVLTLPGTGSVSQCAVSGSSSSASGNGAQLTLTLNFSLPNGFTGRRRSG
jgi:hypothetical protein